MPTLAGRMATDTSLKHDWLHQLPALNDVLQQAGLRRGADVWIRVYDLLLAKTQQGRLPENPQELQWFLSGLIAHNAQEQAIFGECCAQWLEMVGFAHVQPDAVQTEQALDETSQALNRNQSLWKILSLALAGLVLLAGMFWYFQPEPVVEKPQPKPPAPVSDAAPAEPVQPGRFALQPTPVRTDILPRQVPEATPQQAYWLKQMERWLPWLPLVLLGFWQWSRWLRRRDVLRQHKGDPDDPLRQIGLRDGSVQHGAFNSLGLNHALRSLHNPLKQTSASLDFAATAQATAQAAGHFTPVQEQRSFVPSCVMLIGYQHGHDQTAGLASLLQQRMAHAGLEVYTYLFQGTPEQLLPLGAVHWQSLQQVTDEHPHANLLLVSEPDIYLGWTGEPHDWVQQLNEWPQQGLLYTRAPTRDTRKQLNQLGFHLEALGSEGLQLISQRFAGSMTAQQVQTLQRRGAPPPLPPLLAQLTAYECQQDVDEAAQRLQLEALRQYCDAECLRLLTVVAAYPELHWLLTLRLEHALFAGQAQLVRERRLLQLLRLPWLRYGRVPQWLRRVLQEQQTSAQQRETRDIYLQLFQQQQADVDDADLLLPINPKARRDWLRILQRVRQAWLERRGHTVWEDQVFVSMLLGGKTDLLDVLLPKQWLPNLHGRWRSLYPQLLASLLVAAVAGWGVYQGWQWQGREWVQTHVLPSPLTQQLAEVQVSIQLPQVDGFRDGAAMAQFGQQQRAANILKDAIKEQGFARQALILPQGGVAQGVSQIEYTPGAAEAATVVAQQLEHLGWGLTPQLREGTSVVTAGAGSAPLAFVAVRLGELTQAATTFRDEVLPDGSDANAAELLALAANDEPYSQPFTLFRDAVTTERKGDTAGDIPLPTMVTLPGGTFQMGSPENEAGRFSRESPQHEVKIKPFAISQTEITFAQYDAFVEATRRDKPNDESWGRGDRPVINVSWNDAQAYVAWLSEQTGQQYRLPTEAEWEYAARAGTTTPFSTGECIHTDLANYYGWGRDYNECGAKTDVDREQTVPVAALPPNQWGVYAMYGNVHEWVQDCWHDNYRGAPDDASAWEEAGCSRHVLRGGSWGSRDPKILRSANRSRSNPGVAYADTGFRIARAL